jgi:hypothetical protein
MISPKENAFSNIIAKDGIKNSTATDGTNVVSVIYDRLDHGLQMPQSMLAIAQSYFTTGSRSGSPGMTITLAVYHGDASNMSDEAVLDSDTFDYTVDADGNSYGIHVLPVDLSSAKRYLRIKVKQTKTATVTITNNALNAIALFGGMDKVPSEDFAAAGYEDVVQA